MAITLVKYRDAGMHTFTYFWIDQKSSIISPYFDSEIEALAWKDDYVKSSN